MIEFTQTMDEHSLDIRKKGKYVGSLLWHPERPPQIEIAHDFHHIELKDLETITARLKEEKQKALDRAHEKAFGKPSTCNTPT